MKTIFISAFQTFVSRNILNTGVLDELMREDPRIIIFVPVKKEDYYKEIYKDGSVTVIGIENKFSRKDFIFKSIADLLIDTNTKKFHKMIDFYHSRRLIKYYSSLAFTALFSGSKSAKRIFRFLELKLNQPNFLQNYFDLYKPDAVFAADVFGDFDTNLLKTAQRNKVRNIGMVLSWDNNSSKGLMRVIPDTLIVQNEIIRQESIKIQAVPADLIVLSGIAHYDYYKEYKPISREEYCRKLNIDPKKKIVLVSPAGEKFISTDWQIFQILKEEYQAGNFDHNIVFIIRVHPTNVINWGDFVSDENFIIEKPGISFEGVRSKDNELTKEDVHHLIDTIAHSGVVLNVLSSIIIDASVVGVPVITIGFDGYEKDVPFERSVQLYLEEENMAELLKVGATPIVGDRKQLVEAINKYLANPDLDASKRQELVRRQCWKLDGKSKERIAKYILDEK